MLFIITSLSCFGRSGAEETEQSVMSNDDNDASDFKVTEAAENTSIIKTSELLQNHCRAAREEAVNKSDDVPSILVGNILLLNRHFFLFTVNMN